MQVKRSMLTPGFARVLFSDCRVAGAAVAKLAYAVGLKSTGVFPVVGSSPTSRTIFNYLTNEVPSSSNNRGLQPD